MAEQKTLEFLGDFINGQWVKPGTPDGEWEVKSPADLSDVVLRPQFEYTHIDQACDAARAAFYSWSHTPFEKRKEMLLRLKEMYAAHQDELAEIISRETGKPLWESKTEAKAMVGKVDITVNDSINLVEEQQVKNALPGVDGYIRFKPRGVMAVVGPFNFPGHLPNGHIIPALATGNVVVFKPSDKTPAVGQFMAKMVEKAQLPKGVFNLIHGLGETGKRLSGHEHVDGVLFTGSYEVGLKIKQETLNHHWKILALEMGGKNASVIWDDADLEKAVYESIIGSFVTAGQRCSCTSKVILHKNIRDRFLDNFYETAKKLTIGHWKDNPFMGPLISADSVEKFIRFQEIAKREGAESLMRGKALEMDKEGYYVTPSINLVDKFNPNSVYQKSEIFGPNVAVYTIEDFEEALEINNASGYGLSMAIFSKNKELYEKAILDARVGILNWNRTTNGASSRLPFGGMGKSGNDRPSAHFAVYYCTVPVASLEDTTEFDSSKQLPGVNYEFK